MRNNNESPKLNRRDLLKWGGAAALAGAAALGPLGSRRAFASGSGSGGGLACGGGQVIEAFPASPFILSPFSDPLTIPSPLAPCTMDEMSTWASQPGDTGKQDSRGADHQIWPTKMGMPKPIVYHIKLQVSQHSFTTSKVMALKDVVQGGNLVIRAGSTQSLPASCIYGFNGTFPGPMIYAQYGKPSLVRFENQLDQNPYNMDRCDFGAPDWAFLTHLHNGHTEPMSDGNPNYCREAYQPGMYVDNLYLNYPAGGDDAEKQSFFWFHDHRMDHTGANVYKGMVGIYPIYDPINDNGDETTGFRLPGVPNALTGRIDYDVPLVFYDTRLDDGVTPHKDFHNGCGETHPEWWGKTFFRHFPDHGFVGDIFTVNGTAYPQMEVKRRSYRFRLLGASISRIYDFKLMQGGSPVASPGTDGQYLLPGGQQCMKFAEVAVDGGLLAKPVIKDSQQIWPAKRREVVVDFSKYMDGSPTKKGDVVYLVNVSKMGTGRMPDPSDPNYKVPMLKFVIGDDAVDNSQLAPKFRDFPSIPYQPGASDKDIAASGIPQRTFEFQRGSAGGETQWLVNGKPFDPTVSMAFPKQGSGEFWTIKNGGGGWVHPVHFHMEEHRVMGRSGGMAADDYSKEDVVALGPSESVTFYRRFRTFTGKYVAHCHNLAHEDHAMMFGWEIVA